MSRVTEIEARFANHHIPLALALGIRSVTSRIRGLAGDERSPEVQGPPSEFDLAVLGLLALEDRLAAMGRSVDVRQPGDESPAEVTSWLR